MVIQSKEMFERDKKAYLLLLENLLKQENRLIGDFSTKAYDVDLRHQIEDLKYEQAKCNERLEAIQHELKKIEIEAS